MTRSQGPEHASMHLVGMSARLSVSGRFNNDFVRANPVHPIIGPGFRGRDHLPRKAGNLFGTTCTVQLGTSASAAADGRP
jgi:hypothetical protein